MTSPPFPKCGPWISNIRIVWELLRNQNLRLCLRQTQSEFTESAFKRFPGDRYAHGKLKSTALRNIKILLN